MFLPFPYHFRGPRGLSKDECGEQLVREFARLFETESHGVWDPKAGECECAALYVEPLQGTGGYVLLPRNYFAGIKKVLEQLGVLMVVDEIRMGFYRTGKLWGVEHFGVKPDVIVFGKALTNGLNPLSGLWAREELINPKQFPPGSGIRPSMPIRRVPRWAWRPCACWPRPTTRQWCPLVARTSSPDCAICSNAIPRSVTSTVSG